MAEATPAAPAYVPPAAPPTLEESAAVVDAAAAKRAADTAAASRPDWLPPQFTTLDDYVKSATDTKAELTRAQQELAALKKGKEPAADGAPPPELPKAPEDAAAAAQAAADAAGFDLTPFSAKFDQTGDVPAEDRDAIAAGMKVSRALVDQFIDNARTAAEVSRSTAFNEVGGEEAYGAMVDWAKTSLKPAERAAFNSAVQGKDQAAALLAIRGLKQSYEAANGKAPALMRGENRPGSGDAVLPFSSKHEQSTAIQDPRYRNDPAYRQSVINRMMVTKGF